MQELAESMNAPLDFMGALFTDLAPQMPQSFAEFMEFEDLSANAMPDFIAGFIGTMTGHQYQADLEECYISHSGDTVLPLPTLDTAVQTSIGMMRKGTSVGDLIAAPMFLYMIAELPKSLTACGQVPTIVQDEVTILESLAGFLHPVELGKNLTVNYISNKAKIEENAKNVPTFWDSGDYLKSGQSLGTLMTTLLGLGQHDPQSFVTESFLN